MQKRPSQEKSQQEQSQINVYVRIRPLRNQLSKRSLKVIDRGVALNYKDKIHQLYFDGVLDETYNQQQTFQQACLPIVNDVLQGNNASLFVYGQTGTGKTYTMGTLQTIKRQDQGLIPLALNHIINQLSSSKKEDQWSISLSFMQIYMQDIYDLLNPSNGKLQIREDLQYGQTYVQDLVIVPISNYKQSIDLINAGLKYRKIGNQKMNQLSSRSHTIFTIYVSQKISPTEYMASTLSLIDLAGSERVKKSNSTELRLQEAKFINTSLAALGNVISALSQNKLDRFIPYRTSKLTRILKNSLSGKSKVSMICTLQISQENTYQTYSTLLFADRCKEIRFPNQPTLNIESFEEMDQEKDLKIALQRSIQKEKEYIEIIKGLENGGSRVSKDSARQNQLSSIIQSIYKLFGEINGHLKKTLDPQAKPQIQQIQKVTPTTTSASIKLNLTTMAKETIEHINTLSSIAFGQNKVSSASGASKIEIQTLTSLLLEGLRTNLKLYETILIKDDKDTLEKEICMEQYQKQRKQEIISKLKAKKLKNLQNTFEQIWSQNHSTSNPLQSLLNNIRRGEVGMYSDKSTTSRKEQPTNLTNPKEFLKMLTQQQSQRKHKEMLIEQNQSRLQGDEDEGKMSESGLKGSGISYFQNKSSPIKGKMEESRKKEEKNESSNQIKKLLDSLIANKTQFEERKKNL